MRQIALLLLGALVACGLAIAIPLVMCTASINVRIRKMQDLVEAGLTQLFEILTKYWPTRKESRDG